MSGRFLFARAVTAAITLTIGSRAGADDVKGCVDAAERAQELRLEKKLRAASQKLAECARPQCPALVRDDCGEWRKEVERELPSVLLVARDVAGSAVPEVHVELDGKPWVERIDATPVPLDPGDHHLRFARPGWEAVDVRVSIRGGEKEKPVRATMSPLSASFPETVPLASWVLAGAGLVAIGTGVAFRFVLADDVARARETCAPSCSQVERDRLSDQLVSSNIAIGAGIVALVGGIVVFLVAPAKPAGPSASRTTMPISPTPTIGSDLFPIRF